MFAGVVACEARRLARAKTLDGFKANPCPQRFCRWPSCRCSMILSVTFEVGNARSSARAGLCLCRAAYGQQRIDTTDPMQDELSAMTQAVQLVNASQVCVCLAVPAGMLRRWARGDTHVVCLLESHAGTEGEMLQSGCSQNGETDKQNPWPKAHETADAYREVAQSEVVHAVRLGLGLVSATAPLQPKRHAWQDGNYEDGDHDGINAWAAGRSRQADVLIDDSRRCRLYWG